MTKPVSKILTPRTSLANCIVFAILRDTRGVSLRPQQRYNHFATSPHCALTWVFSGQVQMIDALSKQSPYLLSEITFSGPSTKPVTSWNPDTVECMTVGFYPDAWQQLTGMDVSHYINKNVPLHEVNEGDLLYAAQQILSTAPRDKRFNQFQEALIPLWSKNRKQTTIIPRRFADWATALLMQTAMGKTGKSLRQMQRHVKAVTGFSKRELLAYARAENLFEIYLRNQKEDNTPLSQLATDAGYADQSHMGREVRRITGVSAGQFEKLIQNDECYWCYRLLEKYYG